MGRVQGPDLPGAGQPRVRDHRRRRLLRLLRGARRPAGHGLVRLRPRQLADLSRSTRTASSSAATPAAAQEQWLRDDLAANPRRLHPGLLAPSAVQLRASTATTPRSRPFWNALYEAGADVIVNGHDHDYERFAPQTPTGGRRRHDRDPPVRGRDRRRIAAQLRARSRPTARCATARTHGRHQADARHAGSTAGSSSRPPARSPIRAPEPVTDEAAHWTADGTRRRSRRRP